MQEIVFVVASQDITQSISQLGGKTLIWRKPTDATELPDNVEGVLLEASRETLSWHSTLRQNRIPYTSFILSPLEPILEDKFRPFESMNEAAEHLNGLLNRSRIRIRRRLLNDIDCYDSNCRDLASALKTRLKDAMYPGDNVDDKKQMWDAESYNHHIETLHTLLRNPKRSEDGSSIVDLASCVLAARLTKHFIRFRYKNISEQSKLDSTPPGLPTPIDGGRRLIIGWEGLFSLVFAIVDFIDDHPNSSVEFTISCLEDENWIALIISRPPDFKSTPPELSDNTKLIEKYREIAEETIIQSQQKVSDKLWECSTTEGNFVVRLFAPDRKQA